MGNQMQKSISDTRNQKQTSFTFEIDNFSEKKAEISSSLFECGGCEWFNLLFSQVCYRSSQGDYCCDHLAMYLNVASPKSFRTGWKRRISYCFVLLNQSGKELHILGTPEADSLFCTEVPSWGYQNVLPLSKLKEEELLENDKLIIKVEVKVVEAVHVEEVTGKGMLGINGFHFPGSLYSGCFSEQDFRKAPEHRSRFQTEEPRSEDIIHECPPRPPQIFSETELRNAHSKLSELTEAGFKLDWLKEKLEEVALKRKNAIADGSRVQEMEERIKNLELTLLDLRVELKKEKAKSAAAAKVL